MFKNIFKKLNSATPLINSSVGWIGPKGKLAPPFNQNRILKKLSGYAYVAGEINSKKLASIPLRLYARKPTRQSKYHEGQEHIIFPTKKVNTNTCKYLSGDLNHSPSHSVTYKTNLANSEIIEVLDHPILDLLRDVNPYSNQWDLIYTLSLYEQFYGDAYVNIIVDNFGMPKELWNMPSQNTNILIAKNEEFITGYEYGEMLGKKVVFNEEDVIHFKFPSVKSIWYGQSKIEIVWRYINLLDSKLDMRQSFADNLAIPDFLLIAKNASAKDSSLKRLERAWNNKHRGSSKRGKMEAIPGDISVEKLTQETKEDPKQDDALIKAIASGFGLPEYKLLGSSPINANASQQQNDYLSETISSMAKNIEEKLNEQLLTMYDDAENMFLAFDNIIPSDKEFDLTKNSQYVKDGIYTINEVREEEGLQALEGGDELLFNGQPIGQTQETPFPAENNKELKEYKEIKTEEKEPVNVNVNINNIMQDEVEIEENTE